MCYTMMIMQLLFAYLQPSAARAALAAVSSLDISAATTSCSHSISNNSIV
jgi:hypothetical protein